ncbi:MAG TPA: hypothetical protein DCS93_28630 [Microscillaceae bacterium]|nr:hypothetical protein [Microscillaceae bacterium]
MLQQTQKNQASDQNSLVAQKKANPQQAYPTKEKKKKPIQAKNGNGKPITPIQAKNGNGKPITPIQAKRGSVLQRKQANSQGLPTQMQANMESMGGVNMSDVQVNYNSAKPKEIGALAYAQGNKIDIGPGQEKHLPHEAWHVVQQKQGRVQANNQVQAKGLLLNDNPALEKEADVMGDKAMQMKAAEQPAQLKEGAQSDNASIQGKVAQLKPDNDTLTPDQKSALAYIDSELEVARDIEQLFQNIIFDVNLISGLKDTSVFNEEFWKLAINETLDALAVIAPEHLEAIVTVGAKLVKIAHETYRRVTDAEKHNKNTLGFYSDYKATQETQSQLIKDLESEKAEILRDPNSLAVLFNKGKKPHVEIRAQAQIVANALESAQYLSMMQRQGAKIIFQSTDAGYFVDGSYEKSSHYKTALKRHHDPMDNFFLPYLQLGYDTDTWLGSEYGYWLAYDIQGVPPAIIQHVLGILQKNGYPKERLFKNKLFPKEVTGIMEGIGNIFDGGLVVEK